MRINRYLLDVHAATTLETLRRIIPEGASRLISSDRANFNEFDLDERRRSVVPSPLPAYWARLGPIFLAHMDEHPLANRQKPPQQHRGMTFSDYRHLPEWRRSVLYHDYHLPVGTRFQLFVQLYKQGTARCSLAFNREHRDFSAHDRAVLGMISPHITFAWKKALEGFALRAGVASSRFTELSSSQVGVRGLTVRELEILHWLGEGKRNREIGCILELSPRTVGKHLENLFAKLGVENRTAAVRVASDASRSVISHASPHN